METNARIVSCLAAGLLALVFSPAADAQDWARDMFSHTSHDFGTVARGAKVEHHFSFQNFYLEDAHVASARVSCGCTTVEVPPEIIKKWQKGDVIARVDTVNFQGQRDVTITVRFDKPFEAEVQLTIHCYIRTDVVLDPGAVNLTAAHGTGAQQRVIVRYAGRPDWRIQAVESANPNITGQITEISRGNGNVAYQLDVKLAPGAKAGYMREELNLVTNDPNPRAARVPVPVEAIVQAPVTVNSPVIMGVVAAGKLDNPVTRRLVLHSAAPFRITSIESSDQHFRCETPSATSTMQLVPVSFLGADTPGKLSTRIRIQTTASPDPVEADVSVDLTAPGSNIAQPAGRPLLPEGTQPVQPVSHSASL